MKKMKLVMVGNGMAGMRALEELLKIAPDLYDITVFGAEPHPNYNRILLSPVLAGEQTLDEIVLNPLAWYAEHGITLHLGKKVVDVDRARARRRSPTTAPRPNTTGCCWPPAPTPSSCRCPGKELEGVIAYRDIADTKAMIDAAAQLQARGGHRRRPARPGSRQRPDAARHGRAPWCTSCPG